jgi:hypothetical protein
MESSDLSWRKATRSAAQGGCVEVGTTAGGSVAGIRDSKSPERGHLAVTPAMLGALLEDVRRGELDLS